MPPYGRARRGTSGRGRGAGQGKIHLYRQHTIDSICFSKILTTVTKTVKISGRSFKCAISISHGCVTTLSTNIKCSPGKPKLKGSIRFGKDGYMFQVDFQTPNKVLKASLLGVPCPKCSCKSSLCSPPCPSSHSNNSTSTPAQKTTEGGTQGTEQGTTQAPGSSSPGTTPTTPGAPTHRDYSDEGDVSLSPYYVPYLTICRLLLCSFLHGFLLPDVLHAEELPGQWIPLHLLLCTRATV